MSSRTDSSQQQYRPCVFERMTVMLRHEHAVFMILLTMVSSEAFIASPSMRPPWCDRTPSRYHEYRRPGSTTGPFRLKYQALCRRPGSVLEMKTENDKTLSSSSLGYTDITVREAVEWTMNNDSDFTYIDVRSAEEHENLATPRGALCIPAFERAHPVPPRARDESSLPLDEEDYNYENVEWKAVPDFVYKMKAQFKLDAKLLIGYKTKRSAEACRLLAEAGFTSLYNVESRSFVKTREQQSWE